MIGPKNTSSKVDILDIELQEVTEKMSQNISQTLENIELTYDLESETEELRKQSKQFKKQSTQVKRKYWWESTRLTFIIALVSAGFSYYIYELFN